MLKQKGLTRLWWTQARCTFRRKGRRRKLVIVRNICLDLFWKVSFLKKSKKDNPGGSTFHLSCFLLTGTLLKKNFLPSVFWKIGKVFENYYSANAQCRWYWLASRAIYKRFRMKWWYKKLKTIFVVVSEIIYHLTKLQSFFSHYTMSPVEYNHERFMTHFTLGHLIPNLGELLYPRHW